MPVPLAALAIVALFTLVAQVSQGPAPQRVSCPTTDGGVVVADLYGQGDRGVVLAHGGRFDSTGWAPQARTLVDAGFRVLAVDFKASLKSPGGAARGCEYDEACLAQDVLAAVRYLHRTGAKTVSVVGASLGGGGAARATIEAAPGEIDRVVLLAHMFIAKPDAMKGRKLFIIARDDRDGRGTPRLKGLQQQYDKAPDPKRLVILDGDAHAQFIFATPQGPRLMDEILRFLSEP